MKLPTFPDKYDDVQRAVLQQFKLDVMGPHGLPHWSRVLRNGLIIARTDDKVDVEVVTLFALLHDACRENEYEDKAHGIRAAKFAKRLRLSTALAELTPSQFTTLSAAIADHPLGFVLLPKRDDEGAHTIQACWDADRLDLGRIGVKPDPARMGTAYATNPVNIERHWEEAWNTEGMDAMIEAV